MFQDKIQKEILSLFSDDKEYAKKLLEGNDDAIRNLVLNNEILPSEVIEAYESNNIKELYDKAKLIDRKQKLYFKIIDEYYSNYKKEL